MYVLQKFVIPLYKQVRYAIICLSHFGQDPSLVSKTQELRNVREIC